ncbi:hypothetical protein GSB9_02770 [Flavobacteriaceae bacterium GSB9]|nr:hypothetical protein GSB9_02770 [Flavobacteriaceae bacterium GSB9]
MFSVFMVYDYKDKEGRLTKHGRIAIYGIIISLTLSVIGFGFKLKSDSDSKTEKLKQIQEDVSRQELTIKKLDSAINNIQRLSYPLTDLNIELIYTFDSTSKSILGFHDSIVKKTLESINSGNYYGFENNDELYAYWNTQEREGKPNRLLIFNNDKSKLFPKLSIPTSALGLFDLNKNAESMSFQSKSSFNVVFTTPVYKKPNENIIEEKLNYNVSTGIYEYSIQYTPTAQFANPSIISHLDLKLVNAGLGAIRPHDEKNWELKSIIFRNSLGLTSTFVIRKKFDKDWPELTFVGEIE